MSLFLHTLRSLLSHATAGFDLLSDKIRAAHHAITSYSLDAENLVQTAVNAAVTAGCKAKSSFTEGLDKRKKLNKNGDSLSTMTFPATRRAIRVSITPSSLASMSAPSTSTT
jgi:hypothetical protein